MALKLLAYGVSPSAFIDYFQMSLSTARLCLKKLCLVVANDEGLRQDFYRTMTRSDAMKLSDMHFEKHGVRGMLGSLDCSHVFWRCCPFAWQGQYQGDKGTPTIVLEAVIDHNLWI